MNLRIDRRVLAGFAGGAALMLVAGPLTTIVDAAVTTGTIRACVKTANGKEGDDDGGNLRIVGATQACKKNETLLEWNITGPKGDTGPAGPTGATGAQGPKGDTGPAGATGATGATGAQGPKGDKGDPGANGTNGTNGAQGLKGDKGDPGTNGTNGLDGAPGAKGDKGDAGANGTNGINGTNGAPGVKGDKGDTGAQGPKGDTGLGVTAGTCPTGQYVTGITSTGSLVCSSLPIAGTPTPTTTSTPVPTTTATATATATATPSATATPTPLPCGGRGSAPSVQQYILVEGVSYQCQADGSIRISWSWVQHARPGEDKVYFVGMTTTSPNTLLIRAAGARGECYLESVVPFFTTPTCAVEMKVVDTAQEPNVFLNPPPPGDYFVTFNYINFEHYGEPSKLAGTLAFTLGPLASP